jgi:DNA-directed RNA polymerase alpha subunit
MTMTEREQLKQALLRMMRLHKDAQFSDSRILYDTLNDSLSNPATGHVGYMSWPAIETWLVVMELLKEIEPENKVRSLPIEAVLDDFCASVRTTNVLINGAKVKTLGDLADLTANFLMCQPNFGKVSLREVRELLAKYGLQLGESSYD